MVRVQSPPSQSILIDLARLLVDLELMRNPGSISAQADSKSTSLAAQQTQNTADILASNFPPFKIWRRLERQSTTIMSGVGQLPRWLLISLGG